MFAKRNPPIGARPGTLAIPEGSPAPQLYSFSYSAAGFEEGAVTDLDTLENDPDEVNWIDVQGLGDEDALWAIARAFNIHPLALEDAVNAPQRAKIELYDQHLFIVARTPVRDPSGRLVMAQVTMFVGRGYVVTFQERRLGLFDPVRERIRSGTGPIWSMKSDYLAYALLDTLVDRYYPIVEELSSQLDELEDEVIDEPTAEVLPDLYRIRRELVLLRRVTAPQRTAIRDLSTSECPYVSPGVLTYLRDTHDHIAQVAEVIESHRDVCLAIMEMYLSVVGNRTNEIMKVLTLMASVFIPLTFMAGIYGMNFDNMPELRARWAYPVLLLAMAVVAGAMLVYFRRRGWLGRSHRRRRAAAGPGDGDRDGSKF